MNVSNVKMSSEPPASGSPAWWDVVDAGLGLGQSLISTIRESQQAKPLTPAQAAVEEAAAAVRAPAPSPLGVLAAPSPLGVSWGVVAAATIVAVLVLRR